MTFDKFRGNFRKNLLYFLLLHGFQLACLMSSSSGYFPTFCCSSGYMFDIRKCFYIIDRFSLKTTKTKTLEHKNLSFHRIYKIVCFCFNIFYSFCHEKNRLNKLNITTFHTNMQPKVPRRTQHRTSTRETGVCIPFKASFFF